MSEDLEYYQQRALVERSRAKDAPSPEIASVHDRLADLYEAHVAETPVLPEEPFAQDLAPPLHTLPQAQSGTLR
jgi:hypothetical protein